MRLLCVFLESSDLSFIGTEQEPNRPREEMKRGVRKVDGQQPKLSSLRIENPLSKTFQILASVHILIHVCGKIKRERLSARGIPATRGAS